MNIIITGAGKGIGLELVKFFSQNQQHKIIAISRNINALQDFIMQNNKQENIFPISYNLTSANYSTLISKITTFFSNIDLLIHNAGYLVNKTIAQLTSDEFDQIFSVNVKAPFFLTQASLPIMNNPSQIITIGSMGGFQGSSKFSGLSLYSASKGAIAILTECMAEELKDKNIQVNCMALGAVQTEMLQQAFPGYKPPVTAAQMAEFIGSFALNNKGMINGKIIPVALTTP